MTGQTNNAFNAVAVVHILFISILWDLPYTRHGYERTGRGRQRLRLAYEAYELRTDMPRCWHPPTLDSSEERDAQVEKSVEETHRRWEKTVRRLSEKPKKLETQRTELLNPRQENGSLENSWYEIRNKWGSEWNTG